MYAQGDQCLQRFLLIEARYQQKPCEKVKSLSVANLGKLESKGFQNPFEGFFILGRVEKGMAGIGAIDVFGDLLEDWMVFLL